MKQEFQKQFEVMRHLQMHHNAAVRAVARLHYHNSWDYRRGRGGYLKSL